MGRQETSLHPAWYRSGDKAGGGLQRPWDNSGSCWLREEGVGAAQSKLRPAACGDEGG